MDLTDRTTVNLCGLPVFSDQESAVDINNLSPIKQIIERLLKNNCLKNRHGKTSNGGLSRRVCPQIDFYCWSLALNLVALFS